jgi:hypothetical protein
MATEDVFDPLFSRAVREATGTKTKENKSTNRNRVVKKKNKQDGEDGPLGKELRVHQEVDAPFPHAD